MLGAVAAGAAAAMEFNAERLRAAASNPALLATEAADWLVRRGVPFRQAHDVIGQVLREAERQGKQWTRLTLDELKKISPVFERDFLEGPSVESALAACSIPGGTSLESVRAAISQWKARLEQLGASA